jgi:16S rRNA (guanine966-N2)-methyltransferase
VGSVRIVGGALRGRRIRVPDHGVRPTSERTREAIFDILGPDRVRGARVLDLYAGTGALGIEALSRDAARADFVEGSTAVARILERNLEGLGLGGRGRVWTADLDTARLPAGAGGPWDLVFLDPPYEGDAGARWVRCLAESGLLDAPGVVVYERRKGTAVPAPPDWTLATDRTYGDTAVAFYRSVGPSGRA